MMKNLPSAGMRRLAFIAALVALLTTFAWLPAAQAQSGTCTNSTNGGYTVTVCIAAPANGATVSGLANVTATATITGSSSGIGKLIFSLDGSYLLTDYQSPYTFQLPTTNYANGSHTLTVTASMRDGFQSAAPVVTLTFANAATPTPAPAFVPVAPAPPPAGQSLIMAAAGDGAGGEANAGAVTQMVDGWNPDLFLYLGDVYEKGSYPEFYNWYGTSTVNYGLFRDVTNPAIGNHEYENGVAPGYFQFWNNIPNYYSYNAGGWHFIALNSTSQFNQTGTSSAQYKWLLQDLAANTAPCTLAYFHHPVLSAGPQGDTPSLDNIWSQFVQSGVDIVLTGHDHGYQRWVPLDANLNPSPTGITEFVAGAGGHGVQGQVRSDSRLVLMYGDPANAYGAMYFKLNPKGAEYRYYNTAAKLLDQGVVPCSGTTDTVAPSAPTNLVAGTSPSGHVLLTWNGSWDDTGVAGYGIYRDGALLTTIGGGETSYVDMNVGLDVTYSYQVDAVDLGGHRSTPTNTATITRPSQATLIFTALADTYVQSDLPTTIYGTSAAVKADASPDTQSFLRFNLQGLAGSIVNSAALSLYTNSASGIGYGTYSLTGSWDEATTMYGNKPAAGSQVGSSGSYAKNAWVQAGVLPLVTGNGQLDLAVKTTSNTSLSFSSREGANPPQLIVNISSTQPTPTFTPTPLPTDTPTATPTSTPLPTDTPTPVPPTATPTATPAQLPTDTPTATPGSTPLPTDTPTATPAQLPTDTPTSTPTTTAVAGTATPTATAAPAATLTITPVEDAYVSETSANTNYGTNISLRVDNLSPIQRSYLRFNVQGITAPVTGAILRVYAASGSSMGYEVRTVTGSWSEPTVTYNNAPSPGTLVGSSGTFSAGSWTTVDVTSLVAGNGVVDLAMTPLSSTGINFNSREGANPPQLVVTFGGSGQAAIAAAAIPAAQLDLPPSSVDTDGDGVSDADELLNGSNPNLADTDGDGLPDLWEIENGLSPSDPTGANGAQGDPDGDGIANIDELRNGTDPLNRDTLPGANTRSLFLPLVSNR